MRYCANSPDLDRVLALSRSEDVDPVALCNLLNDIYSKGTAKIRPIQALALAHALDSKGLLAPIGVGEGKTLVTLLLPDLMGAKRPLLLNRASLLKKTDRDLVEYGRDWHTPKSIAVLSYERLSRANGWELLEEINPDLIIADEVHRLRTLTAACTRKVLRWMQDHEDTCRFCGLSGTITTRSLMDYWHLALWALRERAPVPIKKTVANDWHLALDEVEWTERIGIGALKKFGPDREAARKAYGEHLKNTPGVVASSDSYDGASLVIRQVPKDLPNSVKEAIAEMRHTEETPDGWPCITPLDIARHARELAMGFYYVWDPRPPKLWLLARKFWCAFVRSVIESAKGLKMRLDSELLVANACQDGRLRDAEWKHWDKIRDTFRPNSKPVWLSDHILDWIPSDDGIIWINHRAVGAFLRDKTDLSYYGRQGLDERGRYIEDCQGGTILASIPANRDGRNLQQWRYNRVLDPPSSGAAWEQLIGRTHRSGQTADEVEVDIIIAIEEHQRGVNQAKNDALYIEQVTGQKQKLNKATWL